MRLLPERRRRWRVMTLKNAAWLAGGLVALFLAVSLWNEFRPRNPSRERLYERRSSAGAAPPSEAPRPAAVNVEEAPVTDETFAVRRNSGLLAPAPAPAPAPPPAAVTTSEAAPRTTLKQARQRGERIVVTGGAEGLRVESAPAPATSTDNHEPPE